MGRRKTTRISGYAKALAGSMLVVAVAITVVLVTYRHFDHATFDQSFSPYTIVGSTTGRINAISCPSPGFCVAGGTWGSAYLMTERNGSWSQPVEVTPVIPGEQAGLSALNDVTCWNTGDCAAVGQVVLNRTGSPYVGDKWESFIVTESRGRWGLPQILYPHESSLSLTLIRCWQANNCIVGGTLSKTDAPGELSSAVVGREYGTRWTNLKRITADTEGGVLTSAACTRDGIECIVSGYTSADGLVSSLYQGRWITSRISSPHIQQSNSTVSLWSSSCAGNSFCSAAGYRGASNSTTHSAMVVVTVDSGSEHVDMSVNLGQLARSTVGSGAQGISCWQANQCLVVGSSQDYRGVQHGLGIVVMNRRIVPFEIGNNLIAVSCTQNAACTVVGEGVNETDDTIFLFGHRGVERAVHVAHQTIAGVIDVISCSGNGDCTAGGYLSLTGDGLNNMPALVSVQQGVLHAVQ